jgi:hypothetical protein
MGSSLNQILPGLTLLSKLQGTGEYIYRSQPQAKSTSGLTANEEHPYSMHSQGLPRTRTQHDGASSSFEALPVY